MVIVLFWIAAIVFWLRAETLERQVGPGPIPIYWLAAGLCCVAFALYGIRERVRLLYGLLEIAIGSFILLGAVNSYTDVMGHEFTPVIGGGMFHRPPQGWLHWDATSASLLPIAAAVYILVRGLDNVGEGLAQLSNPVWTRWWRRLFPVRALTKSKTQS
jgi:hypothetical protein